jgi:pilus assembly protein CpaF
VKAYRVHLRSGASQAPIDLLETRPLCVGRDPSCDVVLGSRAVSRRHVSLAVVEGGILVTDASANGVFAGGRRLFREACVLEAPFELRVGTDTLAVERADGPDPEPPPASPDAALRRRLHQILVDRLDLPRGGDTCREELRPRVAAVLEDVVREHAPHIPVGAARERLIGEIADEVLGLGALEPLLADPAVSEIMVVDPDTVFVERGGRLERAAARFSGPESLRAVIERILTPLGRRIDESNPMVDARLPDGSRVNAVIPPLAVRGPCVTIRRFGDRRLGMEDLVRFGSLSHEMARFLERSVRVRRNIVVSGGTGSGKTTLLGVLSAAIGDHERVVTIEDAAELRLSQEHVVTLEARPANIQGTGEIAIRDLVKNALRMRPDRILVGECRSGEALDMLQAMNTGHEGSMTTTHANSPAEAVARLETLCLMAGLDLPVRAIRAQIASSVHLIVQQSRFSDGTRRVVSIAEVAGLDDHGEVATREIFRFVRGRSEADGQIAGSHRPTGYVPSFIGDFIIHGVADAGDCL